MHDFDPFEEDAGDTQMYRTADFRFPPARARETLEFKADGTFVQAAPGRGDQRVTLPGNWQELPDGRIRLTFRDDARPAVVLQVVSLEADHLELKTGGRITS